MGDAARHYHLLGIGGTAMGSLAGLLAAAGHRVTGSDEGVYPPMSTLLASLGIDYAEGYGPENLQPRPDMVVVGNAISRGNPELEHLLNEKIPYTSAAATIKEEFIRGRTSLAVAGTHGKTSTTSLLAWVLEVAGLNPSFLIGGVAENFGTSFRLTDSPYFVIEADEYDTAYFDKGPKMWHYLPDIAIVNNVEFDHADIYRDEEAYLFAFSRFINLIPSRGTLVAGWDSPHVRTLAGRSLAPVESFGYDGGLATAADPGKAAAGASGDAAAATPRWTATDVSFGATTQFVVRHDGAHWGHVETPLAGAFSVRNCLAVIAAASAVGADPERVREALGTFRSVRRRMEVRGVINDVVVIDDFAHHPTAVRETLAAAKQKYPGQRVVAIFEPRSYTAQRREFEDAYAAAFDAADEIILAGLFHPERYDETSALNPDRLVAVWRAAGREAAYIPDVDDIVSRVAASARPGDVLMVMSNGGFGGIHEKLLHALRTG
ncbi:MAG TPA: UDP-N-acetylmuramate:L-alanyl-gamma-D-glutamyl-meso-diaminopimelate ligase [Longimicrobiales bacterium]|nr:UDP-N-acetylmuramate:L-alanyl-gamma-D-glutamyl-meso-diaminopimelate ligase [Longimicrobiales bacterium]